MIILGNDVFLLEIFLWESSRSRRNEDIIPKRRRNGKKRENMLKMLISPSFQRLRRRK